MITRLGPMNGQEKIEAISLILGHMHVIEAVLALAQVLNDYEHKMRIHKGPRRMNAQRVLVAAARGQATTGANTLLRIGAKDFENTSHPLGCFAVLQSSALISIKEMQDSVLTGFHEKPLSQDLKRNKLRDCKNIVCLNFLERL
jgi:hypothetical protein